MKLRRSAAGVAVASASLVLLFYTASHTPASTGRSSARVKASRVEALRAELGRYGIRIRPMPAGAVIDVDRRTAEIAALSRFGGSAATHVGAVAAVATDVEDVRVGTKGKRHPVIADRKVWIILIPNQQIPITGDTTGTGPAYYVATLAVLVDAHTGKYLTAVTI